jgi:hypothetical protein
MSSAIAERPRAIPAAPVTAPGPAAKTWLVGPWFDLLFVANMLWPLVVLLALGGWAGADQPLSVLQIYFLSTPHRWITLVLVFCDNDRFWRQPAKFGGLALLLIALGLLLVGLADFWPQVAGPLTLLMMLDYIWNAWHFAAQHAGIARIYGRLARPGQSDRALAFERMAIRTLVLWVFFRLALDIGGRSLTLPLDGLSSLTPWLAWLDPLVLIAPAILLVREIAAYTSQSRGRVLYVASVTLHYTAQLLAIRSGQPGLMAALFLGGAIFHAVEYLAICSWSVRKKTTGIWRYQLARTGVGVVVFMAVIGVANLLLNQQSAYAWALVTLLVSLLHYAYDGIIWKSRPAAKPAAGVA